MKLRTKFFLAIFTVLIAGAILTMGWLYYFSGRNVVHQAIESNMGLSEAIHEAVLVLMKTGQQEHLDAYLAKARKLESVSELRVIRSAALEKELGLEIASGVRDDLERQALQSGQVVIQEVAVGTEKAIRTITPFIADSSCLSCHAQTKEGDVMAALSETLLYQRNLTAMTRHLAESGLIQMIVLVFLAATIFFFFNALIMAPLTRIGKAIHAFGQGNWAAFVDLKSKGGKKEYSSKDEVGKLAVAFNEMVMDLKEVTVSRDDLVKEIAVRKQAEESLARMGRKNELILGSTAEGILGLDLQGNHIFINPAAAKILGYEVKELIGRPSHTLWHRLKPDGSLYPVEECPIYAAYRDGKVHRSSSEVFWRKDGTSFSVEYSSTPTYEQGRLSGAVVVFSDITERKLAEENLARLNQQNKIILASAAEGILGVDLEGKHTLVNPAAAKMLGYEAEELIGRQSHSLWHHTKSDGSPYPREDCQIYAAYKDGKVHRSESEVFWRKDGTSFPVEYSSKPIYDQGRLSGAVVIFSDISERKSAEVFQKISRDVLSIFNESGSVRDSIQSVLAVLKENTGFDAVGIRLQQGDDFPYFVQQGFPHDFLLKENTLVERAVDGGLCRNKDGSVCLGCTCGLVISGKTDSSNPLFTQGGSFWTNDSLPLLKLPSDQDPRLHPRNECVHHGYASVALIPIRNEKRVIGLIQFSDRRKGRFTPQGIELLEGIATHIGSAIMRKQAEEALRASEERFKQLFVEAPLGIALIDSLTGRIYEVNPMFAKIAGRTTEEMVRIDWMSITHPDDVQEDLDNMTLMNAGKTSGFQMEKRYLRLDGTVVWISMTIAPIKVEDVAHPRHLCMIENITPSKKAEEALEESEKRFMDVLYSSGDAILLIDGDKFVDCNEATAQMLGYSSRGEFLMTHPSELSPPKQPDGRGSFEKANEMMRIAFERGFNRFEWIHRKSGGEDFPVEVSLTPIVIHGRTVLHCLWRDITENKRLAEALKRSHENLESQVKERTAELVRSFQKLQLVDEDLRRASKAKSEFLANMSHELRTPLNSIIGFSEVLYDGQFGPLNDRQKKYAHNVMSSGRHLLSLINDVLDLSKVESGKMVLEASLFSLPDCLGEVLRLMESLITAKKITSSLEISKDIGEIRGDQRKIKQIVLNLLSNAVKFTPDGGKIGIKVRKIEAVLEIAVWDTGIGVPPEHLEKAFGAFERLGDPYTQETEGTGLGLTIARKMVELHGGKIWIESAGIGQGTAVKFTIPLKI